jgi:hypothetical protein
VTWLGSLPAWALFGLFAGAALLVTLGFDEILHRRLRPEVRSRAGPTASTTLQALATIYAVLVAFVIVNEYSQFRSAQSQVSDKAAQLSIVFENSRNLPEADGTAIRAAALRYAREDLHDGIPYLERTSTPSPRADASLDQLYRVVARIEPHAASDQAAYQQILDALAQVSLTRSQLTHAATATIPFALFAILVVLAAATLAVAAAMDTRHRRSHLMILGTLAIALATTLSLVAGLDYPFRGFIRIDTTPLSQFVANRNAR